MLFNEEIVPYEGTRNIRLYDTIECVKDVLKRFNVKYRQELWSSEAETVPDPWNVLVIEGVMSLFFARNGKLFKIVFWERYVGCLPSGIHTGMELSEALSIDPSLTYDDWNEDYESINGFWMEDNLDNGKIISISVFIKELLDDDLFDSWNH